MKRTNSLKILISVLAVFIFISLFFPTNKEAFSKNTMIQIQNEPYFEEISTKCNNFATNVSTNLLDYPNTKCTNFCIKPSGSWKGSCIGNYVVNNSTSNCMCSDSV